MEIANNMTGNRKKIDTLKLTDIGIRLRGLRDRLNITLEKMKELTGISRSYISDFERGRKLPSAKYLFYLIEDFDADINYIFTGRGEMFLRTKEGAENRYDFGKYEEEINDLLYHIARIPNAFYAVLGYFSEYKVTKEKFIKRCLEKNEEKENHSEEDKKE